jgi:hypothetical protein
MAGYFIMFVLGFASEICILAIHKINVRLGWWWWWVQSLVELRARKMSVFEMHISKRIKMNEMLQTFISENGGCQVWTFLLHPY